MGVGATGLMDLWAALLRVFQIPSLDFAMLGRWLGHLPEGRFVHEAIARAEPVRGERVLGWLAHYAIGITFAAFLLAVFGLEWAQAPRLAPALAIGLLTSAAPLVILQPALGAGIASRKTARPLFNASKSVATHAVFGLGLYVAAWATVLVRR